METWSDNYGVITFIRYKNHIMSIDSRDNKIEACNTKTLKCFEKINGKWIKLSNTIAHIDF